MRTLSVIIALLALAPRVEAQQEQQGVNAAQPRNGGAAAPGEAQPQDGTPAAAGDVQQKKTEPPLGAREAEQARKETQALNKEEQVQKKQVQEVKKPERGTFVVSERSRISISGRAWVSTESVRAVGATVPSTDYKRVYRLSNNSSFLRFRGEYDLGTGWQAWAQIEPQVALDGISTNSSPFNSTRNTAFGLKTPLGTLALGRWDSPLKDSTISLDPWAGNGLFGYYDVFGQSIAGSQTNFSSTNRWNSRLSNGIHYWTPKLEGFQARAAVVAGEKRLTTATSDYLPWVVSASLTFDNGSPLYASVAYERRKGCNPDDITASCGGALLGVDGSDWAARAGVGLKIKETHTRVGLAFERLESKAAGAAGAPELRLKKSSYFASLVQGLFGDTHQLVLSGGVSPDYQGNFLADNDGTGAKFFTGAYRYNWTKDLYLFAAYTRIENRTRAVYQFGANGFKAGAGADPEGVVVGSQFLF